MRASESAAADPSLLEQLEHQQPLDDEAIAAAHAEHNAKPAFQDALQRARQVNTLIKTL